MHTYPTENATYQYYLYMYIYSGCLLDTRAGKCWEVVIWEEGRYAYLYLYINRKRLFWKSAVAIVLDLMRAAIQFSL